MDPNRPSEGLGKASPPLVRKLLDRKRVRQVFDAGRKIVSDRVALFYLKNDAADVSFAIYTKKALGGAVVRNRARRIFREAIRKEVGVLTGVDLIFIPRKKVVGLKMQDVAQELARLFRKIKKGSSEVPCSLTPPQARIEGIADGVGEEVGGQHETEHQHERREE